MADAHHIDVAGIAAGSGLTPEHRAWLHRQGISDETMRALGAFSVTDAASLERFFGQPNIPMQVPLLALPVKGADGVHMRAVLVGRPTGPASTDGAHRYWSTDLDPALYFPSNLAWDAAATTQSPIVLTEFVEEAILLCQEEQPAIASVGPGGFLDAVHQHQTGKERLHPDLERLQVKDTEIYLAFSSATPATGAVLRAEAVVARLLKEAGAVVKLLRPILRDGKPTSPGGMLSVLPMEDRRRGIESMRTHAPAFDPWRRACAVAAIGDWWRQMGARVELMKDPSFWAAIYEVDALDAARTREVLMVRHEDWEDRRVEMAHVLEWLPAEETGQDLKPRLTAAARDLLKDPALLDRFHASLAAGGLVGEEAAADLILLAFISRKERPINLVVRAQSSTGKNFVVESVLAHCPSTDVVMVSDLSPAAINYLAPDAWKNKVVLFSEQEAANRATYQVRTLQSEGALVTLSARMTKGGEISTQERRIEGPITFISTTTKALIHSENETRVLEVVLDESREQTGRIVEKTLAKAGGDVWKQAEQRELELAIWQTALGMIPKVEVAIPPALHQELRDALNLDRVRARRDINKLLSLASASARLFAEQRERDKLGCVIATADDVRRARTLAGALKSQLSPHLHRIADILEQRFGSQTFTNIQAASVLGYGDADSARKKLKELEAAEVVVRATATGLDRQVGRPATAWQLCRPSGQDLGHPPGRQS